MLVGRRTDTVVRGNYWSDNRELDLDGDGFTDRPYRLSSVFDHMRGNLTAADLFARSFAATALSAAETTFPVLTPVQVEDPLPLARAPRLPNVPAAPANPRSPGSLGLLLSLGLVGIGGVAVRAARPRPRRKDGQT
jgi:nitrous oxidase accessory protein